MWSGSLLKVTLGQFLLCCSWIKCAEPREVSGLVLHKPSKDGQRWRARFQLWSRTVCHTPAVSRERGGIGEIVEVKPVQDIP